MTDLPPNCPNSSCTHYRRRPGRPPVDSGGGPFFRRKGSFPRSGARRVVRYQCKQCNRHFSEQTFADDYREKRPELIREVARLLGAGYSQRKSAQLLGVNRKTVSRRARRLLAGRRERRRPQPPA